MVRVVLIKSPLFTKKCIAKVDLQWIKECQQVTYFKYEKTNGNESGLAHLHS